MNRSYSRFDSFASILAGTVTVAAIVVFAPAPVFAKTPQEIAKLAISATVQINGKTSGSGTGFIIAKQGTTYTVLTANHVVADKDTYTIRSHTRKDYPVIRSVLLQKGQKAPDLAVVTFNSAESYPVVTLGDSEQATVGTEIFVFGYPAIPPSRKDQTERNFEFVPGYVTSRLPTHSDGYTLRYNAVTKGGMSGGPVFDGEGRVVGVHGEGDRDFITDNQGNIVDKLTTKTGFNAAIPINTFLAKLSEAGLNRSAILVNTSTAANVPLKLNNLNDAKTYYVRGLTRFD
jgi:S1-C subfamily serine protease